MKWARMTERTPGHGFEELFHRLPAALYRTSPDGEVLAANDATARLLGFDDAKHLVHTASAASVSHVDTQERDAWRATIEAEGTVHDFVVRLRRRSGEIIWAKDTASTVFDDDGEVVYYEGFLVDVTQEVMASNASTILTDVLESTSDFVVVFDETGRLRYGNEAFRRFVGLGGADAEPQVEYHEVLSSLPWRRARAAGRRRWSGEVTLPDAGGTRRPLWVAVHAHAGRDGVTYLSGIARDLTQMKATSRRLEELVAAKDTFVATVSHELRNPLAGVVGLAEEMRDRFEEFGESERHDLITLIAHQAAEMTSLVDDLLVAARDDVGDVAVVPEVVDVAAMLDALTTGLRVEVLVEDRHQSVAWADPQRLRQVLRNLLSNAQRHGGGTVRATVSPQGDAVTVTVADDGPGVDDNDAEQIFEPYRRADGAGVKQGSVGLGLSVARRLARLMQGDLSYRRREGWTEFTVEVPAAERSGLRGG